MLRLPGARDFSSELVWAAAEGAVSSRGGDSSPYTEPGPALRGGNYEEQGRMPGQGTEGADKLERWDFSPHGCMTKRTSFLQKSNPAA